MSAKYIIIGLLAFTFFVNAMFPPVQSSVTYLQRGEQVTEYHQAGYKFILSLQENETVRVDEWLQKWSLILLIVYWYYDYYKKTATNKSKINTPHSVEQVS